MTTRLLDLLVKEGLLTAEQGEAIAVEQKRTIEPVPAILSRLGFLAEGDLLDFLSRKYGIPVVNLERVPVSREVVALVKRELAERFLVFPLRRAGNTLTLALADPTQSLAIDDVQFATGLHVVPVLARAAAIREAIARHYTAAPAGGDDPAAARVDTSIDTLDASQTVTEGREGAAEGDEAPVERFVNLVLADAIRKGASDIHLEPFEKTFRVRYRIDGVLHDMLAPPKQMEAAIVSRLKIMANMDIAERRLPQDGRIAVRFAGAEIDFRVSSLPSLWGETLVLRAMERRDVTLGLDDLGFEAADLARVKQVIQSRQGLVLVTGPTGSGKTTTLYAMLTELSSPAVKIVTAEDPVERALAGVIQIPVREDIGLTHSAVLRAFLRQDPDVILLSEIRDIETAAIAVRTAITGHLVFGTLHTNDAASTVTRLLDMGIEPFLVASSLLMMVAQRLCRRVCPDCRAPVEAPLPILLEAGFRPEDAELVTLYRGAGCRACTNTGYRGLTAIHEVLCVTPELQDGIVRQRPGELKGIAVGQGMRTLRQAGLRKVAGGITTLDEVVRVTFAD